MVHQVIADAAEDGTPHPTHAARAHTDHRRVLLVSYATDDLARLTRRRAQHALDLVTKQQKSTVCATVRNEQHIAASITLLESQRQVVFAQFAINQ